MNTSIPMNTTNSKLTGTKPSISSQQNSVANDCINSICGSSLTETEKIDCLKKNKEQICRCCSGCDYSFKNLKISCRSDGSGDGSGDSDNSGDSGGSGYNRSKPENTSSPSLDCWKKHCDTEDDKNKCLEKSRRSICNCCKENNTDCKFDMGAKGIYDACTNIYSDTTKPSITTNPRTQSLSITTKEASDVSLGLWIGVAVVGLIIIGGGIYYYKKNASKSASIPKFDGDVSKIVPIKQVF